MLLVSASLGSSDVLPGICHLMDTVSDLDMSRADCMVMTVDSMLLAGSFKSGMKSSA